MFSSDVATVTQVMGGVILIMNFIIMRWKSKSGKEKWNSRKHLVDPIRMAVAGVCLIFADAMFSGISPEIKALIYPAVHAGSWGAHRGGKKVTENFKRKLPGEPR